MQKVSQRMRFSLFEILFLSCLSAQEIPVHFTSDPPQSTIYVDDVKKGITPLTLGISEGEHKIQIVKSQFEDYYQSLTILATDTFALVKADLISLTSLNIQVLAPNIMATGNVEVYIDEQPVGFPPVEKIVTQGKHSVRVVSASEHLREYNKAITVSGDINLVTQVEAFLDFTDSYYTQKPETKGKIKKGEITFTKVTVEGEHKKAVAIKEYEAKSLIESGRAAKIQRLPRNDTNPYIVFIVVMGVMTAMTIAVVR